MSTEVDQHLAFLKEQIFFTGTKWPQFERMLSDIVQLEAELDSGSDVVILERAYIYGGDSLFAPLFQRHNVIAIDCEIPSTAERRGFQASWMNDPRCIHIQADKRAPISDTGLPSGCADIVLVPNVVHHEPQQAAMFAEIARLLRPGGKGYIFEALLRELHQIPDDFVRYTPFGFERMFADAGLKMTEWRPTGGPFEAIAYCWIQALQYFPESERPAREKWFFEEHLPELRALDQEHPKNLFREHTSFPVAYSLYFEKAA